MSIFGQNRWQWIVAYHGALKAGAVVNPINVMLTAEELAFVLRDCESVAVFVDATQAQTVVELARDSTLALVVAFDDGTPGTVPFGELLEESRPVPDWRPQPEQPSINGTWLAGGRQPGCDGRGPGGRMAG